MPVPFFTSLLEINVIHSKNELIILDVFYMKYVVIHVTKFQRLFEKQRSHMFGILFVAYKETYSRG